MKTDLLARCDEIMDVLRPPETQSELSEAEIETSIEARSAAKKARDFKRADEIRNQLVQKGTILEDTKDGVRS